MSNQVKAHMSLIAANIIFGINCSVAKEVMPDYLHPLALSVTRVIGAILLFICFDFFQGKREKLARKDILLFVLCALSGVAINQMLFLTGLNMTTPINASILMTATPVIVLIASYIAAREKITALKIAGIIIGFTGAVMLILLTGNISFSSETFTGNLLILINASAWAVFLIISKPLMKKYRPVTVIKWVFICSAFFVLPVGGYSFSSTAFSAIPPMIWLAVFFVVFASTFLTYLFNIYGLKFVNPSTTSIYIYIQPVVAALMSIILDNDQVTMVKVISSFLVFVGVYMVGRTEKKEMEEVNSK